MKDELTLTTVRKTKNLEKITKYVMACRTSGMTCKDWCQENNIPLTTYYGWQRRVFDAVKANGIDQHKYLVRIFKTALTISRGLYY